MQRCIALIVCLFLPYLNAQEPSKKAAAAPAAAAPTAPYVERYEKQINFFPGGKLQVSAAVPGNVKIVGWGKGSIRVEAERIVYYLPPEDAKALLQKFPIRVRYTPTTATVQTTGSAPPPATMECNLTVYVPGEKTDLKVQVSRGDLSLESVNGWVEASIQEGSLDAKSMAGYFSFSTQRGDICAEMSGSRWNGLEFAALTKQGSVELRLPKKYDAALRLETRDGKVVVNYPPQEVDGELMPPEIVISKKAQSLKASVGDGGAPIRLSTHSGDITLIGD